MANENIVLIPKLADCLSGLGVNNLLSDQYIKYFKGEITVLNPLDKTKRIDMDSLSYDIQNKLRNTFTNMKDSGDTYYERFLNIMLDLGGASFLDALSYVFRGFSRVGIDTLLSYNIQHSIVICWMLQTSVDREFIIKNFVFDKIEVLFNNDGNLLSEVCQECSINAKLYLSAMLVSFDKRNSKKTLEWIENVIKNSLADLFSKKISSDGLEQMTKYINGGLFVNDNMIPNIARVVDFKFVNSYILQLLLGVSYIIINQSNIARRFIKLMVMLDYQKSLNAVYSAIKNDTYNQPEKLKTTDLSEAIELLGIPRELYIAWLGSWSAENSGSFDRLIREELNKNRKAFYKAVNLKASWGTTYLNRFLWEQKENLESYSDVENTYIQSYEEFFNKLDVPKNIIDSFIDFLLGRKELEDIKESAKTVFGKQTIYTYNLDVFLKRISWIKNVSSLYNRSICLFVYSKSGYVLKNIAHDIFKKDNPEEFSNFIKIIEGSGAGRDGIIPLLAEYACGQFYSKGKDAARAYIADEIRNNTEEVIQCISECSADGRVYLMEEFFNVNKARSVKLLIEYTNDTSKAVRGKVIDLLGGYRAAFNEVEKLLSYKKQTARECAIHILSIWNDEKSLELLYKAMENEKSDKLKTTIANILKVTKDISEEAQGDINIIDYCKRELKKIRGGSLGWLDFETIAPVRFKDSEEAADTDLLKYLLLSYATNNIIGMSLEAKKVSYYLSQQDLADVVFEILNRWIDNGAEAKKKWVMSLATIHGDDRVVMLLKKKIEEWPAASRGAIAAEAVNALALNGSSLSLMIIDNISRKFKFRQVKEAASKAFAFAAKELEVDPEELSDKIVPNLDFNQRGERIFDYGSRKFKVVLSPILELEVFGESDKKLKALPAIGKNDDEEKASQALDEYKSLKKQLKSVVSIQTIRLETALSTDRKWTKESWIKLFVENPIMHKFAIGLIWGTYQEGVLKYTFRYMEDGSFNTKEEDEFELADDILIGLVHPIELDEDDLIKWKTQLEDYEVKQPFEQISRKVYKVTEEEIEEKYVVRFGGIIINGLSLLGKLTKFGWYKGSVQDGGCYYNFYKEDSKIGIGAELQFSGVGVGYENEDVTVYEVIFYIAGTVKRGSYIYDNVGENNLLKPIDVAPRFFSEILYDVDRATVSKTGVKEDWKKDR